VPHYFAYVPGVDAKDAAADHGTDHHRNCLYPETYLVEPVKRLLIIKKYK
jgi:hypothetical protein